MHLELHRDEIIPLVLFGYELDGSPDHLKYKH